MRVLKDSELMQVAGGGDNCSWLRDVFNPETYERLAESFITAYEESIDGASYLIGRVAGDLHPSYYQ